MIQYTSPEVESLELYCTGKGFEKQLVMYGVERSRKAKAPVMVAGAFRLDDTED